MWIGILVSLKMGTSEREFLTYVRGLGIPFIIEATGHRLMYVLRSDDPKAIEGFLIGLRLGIIPINGITLARPFNKRIALGETKIGDKIIYDLEEAVRLGISEVLQPRPLSVRLRARGHGLGIGETLKSISLDVLKELNVRISKKSNLILNVEVLRTSSGELRLYIGYHPKYLYVRYASVYRMSQPEDVLIPKAKPFTQFY